MLPTAASRLLGSIITSRLTNLDYIRAVLEENASSGCSANIMSPFFSIACRSELSLTLVNATTLRANCIRSSVALFLDQNRPRSTASHLLLITSIHIFDSLLFRCIDY